MSRYADQLPIVTEPTPGNFLLGTDENDPKALVRIPAEGLGGGGSTEYTILDETALDVDSNVALSAGLYLYVGNAPANFDLSGLVDGERVEIINHTDHKIYLFGFTDWVWNGLTTALQANKGLVVEKGGLIAVKHSDKLLVFNTLPNGLVQNWKVGFIPPGYLYWRVSYTGILTEIQMDLGFGAQRISAANGVASISPVNALTDGGIPATNTGFVNSTTLNFQGENNLDIKDFWISPQNAGSAGPIYNSCQTFTASYSEDGINYTPLGVGTIQVSNSVATVYSPYSGTILRPAQLVKVGFST